MKMMMAMLALGGVAAYFFTRNRKVEFELEIEPKDASTRTLSADEDRWMTAGAE